MRSETGILALTAASVGKDVWEVIAINLSTSFFLSMLFLSCVLSLTVFLLL
jgi:hypothetical protein